MSGSGASITMTLLGTQITTSLSIATSDKPYDILTTTYFSTIKSPNSNSRIPLPSLTWRIYTLEWLDLRSLLTIMILLFVCLSGRKVYIYIIPGLWFGPISPLHYGLRGGCGCFEREGKVDCWLRAVSFSFPLFIYIHHHLGQKSNQPQGCVISHFFCCLCFFALLLLLFTTSCLICFLLYFPCLDHCSFMLMSMSLSMPMPMPMLFLFCFCPVALFPCFSYAYLTTLNSYSPSLDTSTYYHYYSIIISLLLQKGQNNANTKMP